MLRDIIKSLNPELREQVMKNFDSCESGLFEMTDGLILGVHIEDFSSFDIVESFGVWSLLRKKT